MLKLYNFLFAKMIRLNKNIIFRQNAFYFKHAHYLLTVDIVLVILIFQ